MRLIYISYYPCTQHLWLKQNVSSETMSKRANIDDIVHSLSQSDRLLYLVYGYIRSIQKCIKNTIPNEIKYLCKEFINFKIKSNTEIKIEEAWKKDPVWYHKKYMFLLIFIYV